GSGEYRFVLNRATQDWTQYQVIITVPGDNVTAVSVRPRTWPLWYGTAYYDDFALNGLEAVISSVEEAEEIAGSEIPTSFDLKQNFPNPFNPSTMIQYALPVTGPVKVEVFNILGQKIATLVDRIQTAGSWQVEWTGRDDMNRVVATGIYLYRISSPSFTMTKKMVFMK
ncbi:MAG TPA: T9SS type A sorting domain-containing protein, partial [Bacteroidota bacterium]